MTSLFAAGVLPNEVVISTVTPLYKSGDKLDPVNYRRVNLTSINCKVMEKIIVKKLLAHMAIPDNKTTNFSKKFIDHKMCLKCFMSTIQLLKPFVMFKKELKYRVFLKFVC
jgi:hypothetical protein